MNTILLVEQNRTELDLLVALVKQWRQDIKILTAMDETVTLQLMANHPIDLILCALSLPGSRELQTLSLLINQYSHIPLIAIGDHGADQSKEVYRLGASHYHERPLNSELLLEQASDLLDASTSGSVKGIPLHSFLQMLEGDAQTCTLQCRSGDQVAFIYIIDGVLIDAECGPLLHEEAIYEAISWDDIIIQIKFFNGMRADKIRKPLMSIIMEGVRLKDEKLEKDGDQGRNKKTIPRFKRFLTAGHRLSLDFGARVTVEFENIDASLSSIMVGMIPNSHLIFTTPEHFSVTKTKPMEQSGILVKYLHRGKLCFFKSVILRTIHHPRDIFFLSYPSLIHYHELRKAKRVAIYIPCSLSLTNAATFQGALINLSYTGGLCQLLAKTTTVLPNVRIGEQIIIGCQLPGLAEEQAISGTVRNIHENIQEARLGIEFHDLSPAIQNTINHYLNSIEQVHT